ncbi:CCAAT-binding factor [Abeliophyllum distichum]|uniref:CCAAT-binding factor n=1 Tax=Abeliophyllum distichum TaxID=126358 RepID=A0ABD1R0G5_9LAMI
MVTSKVGKRYALAAFEALKELFISSLLPDRKLKTLVQQPLNQVSDTKDGYSLLLFWYWEECLKERYERFVSALEEASQDLLDILRNKALKTMCTLLRSKSEQERRLLSALVNKLGHRENKVASNADYHLANLLADHPNMKALVIDKVDNFLLRPHLGLRAKYHAVNFLSQICLSHKRDGPKAAKHFRYSCNTLVALQLPPQYARGYLFLLSVVLKARPPLWNMVIQNESADEDLEHFEDIADDDNKQASLVLDNRDNKDEVAQTSNESNIDSDSSLDKGEGGVDEIEELKSVSDPKGVNHLQRENNSPTLPGEFNPRHREPAYQVSWWELTVLSLHVHSSIAAMARTLLSGANIVYSGNPFNDLSLGAFLDKFMEKKPTQSTWHGAAQIEPAKKLDMKNQLTGPEIVSLAEEDVPPGDLVFHKFYMNKLNSSKKPKKKKKTADDEAAEEFYVVDGDDESGSEEIENVLDSANHCSEVNGDFDYDHLDKIANEDDDDLIGSGSDEEVFPSDFANMEIEDADTLGRRTRMRRRRRRRTLP